MSVSYAKEKVSESFFDEIMPILEDHRLELSSYSDMELKPNFELYYYLQENNQMVWYVARDEGKIVGYSCYFLLINPHYSDFVYAHQDVFYVTKQRRGSKIAKNLITMSEIDLEDKGISVIVHHTKPINSFGKILEKLGYDKAEVVYHKRIDKKGKEWE